MQVGDQVVDRARRRVVQAQRVLRLARPDPAQVVGQAGIEEVGGPGTGYADLAQVGHIEHTDRGTHGGMFLEYPAVGVLERHLPAPEGGELGTEVHMPALQR